MRFICVVLVLLAIAPAVRAQVAGTSDAAAGIIESCAGSADPALVGLDALESACPGLRQALADSGYLPFISAAGQQALTPDQLLELQDTLERYREPARPDGIEVDSLDGILRSLQQPHEAERSLTWLGQLRKWLRELMDGQGDSASWLAEWLEDVEVSDAVSRTITYALIILVICLALVAVINELRVAGVLRRRGAREPANSMSGGPASPAAGTDGADLDGIAGAARAPLLLRQLIATLVRTGRLTAERSLTHRELGLRASFDAVDQRECFQRVAALAERVVYGGSQPPPDEFEPLLDAGRDLNMKLGGVE